MVMVRKRVLARWAAGCGQKGWAGLAGGEACHESVAEIVPVDDELRPPDPGNKAADCSQGHACKKADSRLLCTQRLGCRSESDARLWKGRRADKRGDAWRCLKQDVRASSDRKEHRLRPTR